MSRRYLKVPLAKKFVSYTGLIPSTYVSAGKVYHGRITKQDNKHLR